MATIPTIEQNDNAATLRQRVNAAINAVNRGSTPSGGGGSSDGSDSTDRVLNILLLGNSHMECAWEYVPYMLQEYGIKVRIMIYRGAGWGIHNLNTYYTSRYGGGEGAGKIRFIDTSGDNGDNLKQWQELYDYTTFGNKVTSQYNAEDYMAQEAVLWNNTRWDLVVIQDNYSAVIQTLKTTFPSLDSLIGKIQGDLSFPPLLGLQVVHTQDNFGQNENWGMFASLAAHSNLYNGFPFDMYFPSGTAIANARNTTEIITACNGRMTESLGIHLLRGLPSYISALSCIESLFRRFYPQLTVLGDPTRVTSAWRAARTLPTDFYDDIPTSEDNALLAQRIALLANDHPWDIKGSSMDVNNRKEPVTLRVEMPHGIRILGAIDPDTVQCVITNPNSTSRTYTLDKHCSVGGKVEIYSDGGYSGTITSVSWTQGGLTHNVDIVNNKATLYIKDIRSETVITITGENIVKS